MPVRDQLMWISQPGIQPSATVLNSVKTFLKTLINQSFTILMANAHCLIALMVTPCLRWGVFRNSVIQPMLKFGTVSGRMERIGSTKNTMISCLRNWMPKTLSCHSTRSDSMMQEYWRTEQKRRSLTVFKESRGENKDSVICWVSCELYVDARAD